MKISVKFQFWSIWWHNKFVIMTNYISHLILRLFALKKKANWSQFFNTSKFFNFMSWNFHKIPFLGHDIWWHDKFVGLTITFMWFMSLGKFSQDISWLFCIFPFSLRTGMDSFCMSSLTMAIRPLPLLLLYVLSSAF